MKPVKILPDTIVLEIISDAEMSQFDGRKGYSTNLTPSLVSIHTLTVSDISVAETCNFL